MLFRSLADANNPDTNAGQYKAAQEAAFEERLVNGLGVNIVNSQYASDTNASMNVAEAILAANPDVKIISPSLTKWVWRCLRCWRPVGQPPATS